MRPRSSHTLVRALVPLALIACPARAAAQRPISESLALARVTIPERPRATVTTLLENDNKLLSLWQLLGTDGNDLGRTHGAVLGGSRRLNDYLELWAEYQTTLFTEEVLDQWGARVRLRGDLTEDPSLRKNRHIHFNELDYFRAGVHRYLPRLGIVVSAGGGAVVQNRKYVTLGGTGQQRAWHDFIDVFDPTIKEYRYIDDGGGVRWGAVASATLGVRRQLFETHRFRLTVDGGVGAWLSTLGVASYLGFHVAAELGLGRRRAYDLPFATLRGAQYVEDYVVSGSVLLDTRVQLDFHTRVVDVAVWFDGYSGSPNNAFFVYNFRNTTTTLGFVFRVR